MFEVLLQAEKALSSGALDQAERSYWQLIELDPTNAIAVAGLARVSLERGDRRLARTFADRALVMDPGMVAARRILETLSGGVPESTASNQPDLPLLAAQRLEELGRRRAAGAEDETAAGTRAGSVKPGKRDKDGVDDARKAPPQLPAEPPAEGRQAGRQTAAAAATAAAATTAAGAATRAAADAASRPPGPPRPKAHQALGDRARRNLVPEDLKPRPRMDDPFAAAESAAAIEAVDQTDDVVIEEHVARAGRAPSHAEDELGEVYGAIEATGEDESIAMRVALVADSAELEAAEMDAAEVDIEDAVTAAEREAAEREAAELDENVFGVAELVASEELGPPTPRWIDLEALEADLRAAELRAGLSETVEADSAAPVEADSAAQMEVDAAAQMEFEAESEAELMAAELASAEQATARRASEWIPGTGADGAEGDATGAEAESGPREPAVPSAAPPARHSAAPPAGSSGAPAARRSAGHSETGEEPTEDDAEAAALREAVALVLGGEPDSAGSAGEPGAEREVIAENDGPGEPGADGAGPANSNSRATLEPRRKGLLRKFRGD